MSTLDIAFFSYVLVENAQGLHDSQFVFLREMFSLAVPGSVFVFMDSSYKLWDDVRRLAEEIRVAAGSVSVEHPRFGRMFGNTMVLTIK